MRFGWSAKLTSARILGLASIAALIFLAVYVIIYQVEPFSEVWNLTITNLFLVAAALFAAAIATMIWAHYDPTDTPRRVWGHFATGLWLWAAAEMIWGYLNVIQGEVPVGLPDVFWVAAYFFFGQALLFQYQILARPTKQELLSRALFAILFLLVLNLLVYRALTSGAEIADKFDVAIDSFYPAADLLLALVALWLARNFMGGAFSRPWLGLLAFTFADLMYAWLEISGMHPWSVNGANLLSTITDIAYLGAYLILGLGVLCQWAFLKYGMRSPGEMR